ncbi:hypothetical protein BG53_08490 [Paenibacillus darwinianus]|uniref:Uncharacterized protein n=1 Tax=Paenibacillus darwinianus TaxID=1380763 RepID=A0A9W5W6K9_9BACL|nr:hypothetical protein CH50_10600 [Paenibacillus darwinianus]EXX85387.1 hypothetical protein BG53_08490 [Paenibacillus darwinianus]EXX85474.1 hypothetical protein BG52_08400 [Paenibacillus darwinianus]
MPRIGARNRKTDEALAALAGASSVLASIGQGGNKAGDGSNGAMRILRTNPQNAANNSRFRNRNPQIHLPAGYFPSLLSAVHRQ